MGTGDPVSVALADQNHAALSAAEFDSPQTIGHDASQLTGTRQRSSGLWLHRAWRWLNDEPATGSSGGGGYSTGGWDYTPEPCAALLRALIRPPAGRVIWICRHSHWYPTD